MPLVIPSTHDRIKIQARVGFHVMHTIQISVLLSKVVELNGKHRTPNVCERLAKWNRASLGTLTSFCVDCFLRMKGTSPLPQRQNPPYPLCILFRSVGADFLVSFVLKWTTGIRKRNDFVVELLSRNAYFVIIFQVIACHSSFEDSLDWRPQHFSLLNNMILFPSFFRG